MDLFISGLFQALISAIASGAVLLIIQRSLDKNKDDAKKASDAEKELLENKLGAMALKIDSLEGKLQAMELRFTTFTEALYEVKERVQVVITRQDEFKLRLFEVLQSVEKLKEDPKNFGKIIVKK